METNGSGQGLLKKDHTRRGQGRRGWWKEERKELDKRSQWARLLFLRTLFSPNGRGGFQGGNSIALKKGPKKGPKKGLKKGPKKGSKVHLLRTYA